MAEAKKMRTNCPTHQTRINGRFDAFDGPIKRIERRFDLGNVAINLIHKVTIILNDLLRFPQGLSVGALQAQLRFGNSIFAGSKFTFEPIKQRRRPVCGTPQIF